MTSLPAIPLSVLDLAPVVTGFSTGQALRNTLDLALHCETLGFHRYWLAEHHNMPGIASSAPAVLIAHVAAATTRLRVGSGGVMLPNHPSLVVAEQFGMLEALHPGRIDLGIGRAPGTDPLTAQTLRRSTAQLTEEEFPEQLWELFGFFDGSFPADHPYSRITPVPASGNRPEIWLLGSSGYSAQVAGLLGLPFAFAHHFSAVNTMPALALYRARFRPSSTLARPYSMIAVGVICAPTDEEARRLAEPAALSFVRLRSGRPSTFPTPQEAAAHEYTESDRALLTEREASLIVGSPETVRDRLAALLEATRVDELMITTTTFDHADRRRSYELVARLFNSP